MAPYPMLVFAQESGSHPLLAEEIYQIPNPDKVIYVQDRGTMNNSIAGTGSSQPKSAQCLMMYDEK